MYSRQTLRSARAQVLRASRPTRNVRFNSTAAPQGMGAGVTGGIVGGLAVVGVAYGWYHFSGTKKIVNSAQQAVSSMEAAKQKIADATPEPKEALRWIRSMAQSYAAFIPGAKPVIDTAFDDLDKVSQKHGDKVDKLVTDTYNELKAVAKDGSLDVSTATKAYGILQKKFEEIKELAKDVGGDIMKNHPEIKEKLGGKFDEITKLADKLGPDAKKQLDDVYSKVHDITKNGLSAGSMTEVTKLVSEKYEELKKQAGPLYEEAYNKALETAKPYLEKYPDAKKFLEQNKDALKSGNMEDLVSAVKKAAESKDMGSLQGLADKAKGAVKGTGIESMFEKIPNKDEILKQYQTLTEVATKHGKEAEDLATETWHEVLNVLKKKAGEATKIAESAKKDASK